LSTIQPLRVTLQTLHFERDREHSLELNSVIYSYPIFRTSKKNDAPTLQDFSDFIHKTNKFKAFLGGNSDDLLSNYLGPNIHLFSSPLVRSAHVIYYTIHPYNGKKADCQQISPSLQAVFEKLLNRKLQDSDFSGLDTEKIQDTMATKVRAMLHLLGQHQLIIPGVFSGGDSVYLLVHLDFPFERVDEVATQVRKELPHFA